GLLILFQAGVDPSKLVVGVRRRLVCMGGQCVVQGLLVVLAVIKGQAEEGVPGFALIAESDQGFRVLHSQVIALLLQGQLQTGGVGVGIIGGGLNRLVCGVQGLVKLIGFDVQFDL